MIGRKHLIERVIREIYKEKEREKENERECYEKGEVEKQRKYRQVKNEKRKVREE